MSGNTDGLGNPVNKLQYFDNISCFNVLKVWYTDFVHAGCNYLFDGIISGFVGKNDYKIRFLKSILSLIQVGLKMLVIFP